MVRISKGVFLKNIIKVIEEQKGKQVANDLLQKVGLKQVSAFKNYPIDAQVSINHEVVEVLFGEDNSENQVKLGKLAFDVYAKSFTGKTLLTLLGNKFEKVAAAVEQIARTTTSGIKIFTDKTETGKFIIRVENNPFPYQYGEGLILGATEYFGLKAQITVNILDEEKHEYIINFE